MPTLDQLPPSIREKYLAEGKAPVRRWGYHESCPTGRIFDGPILPDGWSDHPLDNENPAQASDSASGAAPSPDGTPGARAILTRNKRGDG
jgi:hypothetical protein